ncbi:TPR repeat domain-containing protein [Chloropicon primus]|nr:TPR repeat domain-containing protein [Chloropicon primus]
MEGSPVPGGQQEEGRHRNNEEGKDENKTASTSALDQDQTSQVDSGFGEDTGPVGLDESVVSSFSPVPSLSDSSISMSDELYATSSPSSFTSKSPKKGVPENIIELRRKAKSRIQREEFSEALSLLDTCIALSPRSANLFRLRCLCFSRLGMHEKALQDALVIKELKPNSCTSGFHLGSALYGVGDYSSAAKAFQQGLEINPHDRALRDGFRNALTMIRTCDRPRETF